MEGREPTGDPDTSVSCARADWPDGPKWGRNWFRRGELREWLQAEACRIPSLNRSGKQTTTGEPEYAMAA